MRIKIIFVLMFAMLISACENRAVWRDKTTNPKIDVDLILEYDGCKVYRFMDGRSIYFTNCKGSTQWNESCGKNCSKDVEVRGGR